MTNQSEKDNDQGRAAARRTALVMALIAIAVYVGFIFSVTK